MTDVPSPEPGTIVWTDLTVPNATEVRDFYREVVGWTHAPVEMGGYEDYSMNTAEAGTTVAGICHARGVNTGIPPQWLIYITVEDLDGSIQRCKALGGEVIHGPRTMGQNRFCVIRDTAGAVVGLVQ